jgi:hypothetical protein
MWSLQLHVRKYKGQLSEFHRRCARPFAAAKCSLGQARHMGVAAGSGSRAEDVLRYSCQAWQLASDDWPVLRLL